MEEKVCPCCNRHCPADALSCHRGMEYFGASGARGGRGEGRGKPDEDEVVILLRRCGHALHHGHGGGGVKFDFLTEDERAQLTVLLKKCANNLEK